jgi:hypothetical protein
LVILPVEIALSATNRSATFQVFSHQPSYAVECQESCAGIGVTSTSRLTLVVTSTARRKSAKSAQGGEATFALAMDRRPWHGHRYFPRRSLYARFPFFRDIRPRARQAFEHMHNALPDCLPLEGFANWNRLNK